MEKYYSLFDEIRCVSKDSYNVFFKCFPNLRNKIMIEYNHINQKEIYKLSKEEVHEFEENNFNILTVARLSEQKGIDLAIDVMNNLVKENKNIRWFVCRGGNYLGIYCKSDLYCLEIPKTPINI